MCQCQTKIIKEIHLKLKHNFSFCQYTVIVSTKVNLSEMNSVVKMLSDCNETAGNVIASSTQFLPLLPVVLQFHGSFERKCLWKNLGTDDVPFSIFFSLSLFCRNT